MASILLLSGVVLGFTLSDCCPPAFFYISDIDVWGDSNVGGRLAGQARVDKNKTANIGEI